MRAIGQASADRARAFCFPECFVPGYRGTGKPVPPPERAFLERAWSAVGEPAAKAAMMVVLGTVPIMDGAPVATAPVTDPEGSVAGFQAKVQIDPRKGPPTRPAPAGSSFQASRVPFGVAICHEGWRCPETVRWAARRGAQIVFHPHFHEAEPGYYRPTTFAGPADPFHEKAALCRAAENTCSFATVNYASPGAPTTLAVVCPDGTLPYREEGLLAADIDITASPPSRRGSGSELWPRGVATERQVRR